MDHPLRRPDEILAYRPLRQILAARPNELWTIGPKDNVLTAMHLMADKNIGFLVVMENKAIVGVISERDCVRRLVLAGKAPEATPVAAIMVQDVVTADIGSALADCLKLMQAHHIRHLPVMQDGTTIGVLSIRDLLSEAVAHHAKVIDELERERLTLLMSTI